MQTESKEPPPTRARHISIGIIAWNEEQGIGTMLNSLFQQSIFTEIARRGQSCEIICVANGCSDRTPEIVAETFAAQTGAHPHGNAIFCRVMNLSERGKV